MNRHQAAVVYSLLCLLLVQAAVAMVRVSITDAPTFDEPGHLAATLEYAKRGDLNWSPEHPPMSRLIEGLPLRFVHVNIPEGNQATEALDSINHGVDILYRSGNDGQRLVEYARWPIVAFTLLVIVAVFAFGTSLWGPVGGLVAAAVASFDPTILAHGHLATTDMCVAGFSLASAWLLYESQRAGGRRSLAFLLGGAACAGGALASKFTALTLLPCFVLLAAWPALQTGRWTTRAVQAATRIVTLVAVALAVVWLAYLAVSPSLRYDRPHVSGPTTGAFAAIAKHLPAPVPYRDGLVSQIQVDGSNRSAFLLGDRYRGGKVSFYPLVLLIKTPLATLALMCLGLAMLLLRRERGWVSRLVFVIALPAAAVLFAMAANTNIGIRHILVAPIFGAVLCGAAAVIPTGWLRLTVVGALVVFLAVSSLRAAPSYLAYENEAFGSGQRGYRQLSDSNIDWGQDLARLRPALDHLPKSRPIWLAYFGTVPPSAYGIHARTPDPGHLDRMRGGIFAVSVSILNTWQPGLYDRILHGLEPFDQIGHSILLYRIPETPSG